MTQRRLTVGGRRIGIGGLVVFLAFLAFLTTWALALRIPALMPLRNVLLAGFIGGFTDTIAINMLFTERWYLPGSGVLIKQKDAIVRSLADTLEEHILNPSLIESRVRELAGNIDRTRIAGGINAAVDEIRPDLVAYVTAPEQRDQVAEAIRREGGFWGDMANALGIMTYGDVTDRLLAGIVDQIDRFRVTPEMVDAFLAKIGSLDDLVLRPGNPLLVRHYGVDKSLAQIVFEQLDAKRLVVEKLSSYDASQVRDIVADNVSEHLGWLQVFGVILGTGFAALIALLDALL